MRWSKWFVVAAFAVFFVPQTSSAEDQGRSYQLKNRLRLEYDDNIYEEKSGEEDDSINIIEELELLYNVNMEQTYLGLRYRPAFQWWSDREPDDDDVHHDFDFIFAHNFTPRLSLNLKDTFRLGESPELIDRGDTKRTNGDFIYNIAEATASYLAATKTRIEASGRYTLLRYDENDIADTDDYDIYAGGLTLRQQLTGETVILGDYRAEEVSYTDNDDRSSLSHYIGLGLEHVFSPNLLGNIRGGYQNKEFESDEIDSESSPYVDGSLTYLYSPQTRLTAGAGYSLFEADVDPFANQERTLAYISLAHDLTARVSLFLSGSYQIGDYQSEQRYEDRTVNGVDEGEEEILRLSARGSYKINHSNWLELGWQYLDVDSDLREPYDRNRYEIGWRTEI